MQIVERPQEARMRKDDRWGQMSLTQQVLRTVDIVQNRFEQSGSLTDGRFQPPPFIGG